jgi:hypothetical protein
MSLITIRRKYRSDPATPLDSIGYPTVPLSAARDEDIEALRAQASLSTRHAVSFDAYCLH